MDDLKQRSLEELAVWAQEEKLIDACFPTDLQTIIIVGGLRIVLTPTRAHAFLRGVLRGIGGSWRRFEQALARQALGAADVRRDRGGVRVQPRSAERLVDTFRDLDVLTDHWRQYKQAGCPFGFSHTALLLWSRHETQTTVN